MKTLKTIGAYLFAFLAIMALCSLIELAIVTKLGFSNAPPAGVILRALFIALVCAALSVALYMNISKDNDKTTRLK